MQAENHFYNCCLPQCYGFRYSLVHKFPKKPERLKAWLEALEQPTLTSLPLSTLQTSAKICARHFRPRDYRHPLSRSLNIGAVPSLNLKALNELHLCKVIETEECDEKVAKYGSKLALKSIKAQQDLEEIKAIEYIEENRFNSKAMNISVGISLKRLATNEDEVQFGNEDSLESSTEFGACAVANFYDDNATESHQELNVNTFWLRNQCDCSSCYDNIHQLRKFAPYDLTDEAITPSTMTLNNESVHVLWQDNHRSLYNLDNLSVCISKETTNSLVPYNADSIHFKKLINSEESQKQALQSLRNFGYLLIEGLPKVYAKSQTSSRNEFILRRIFPHFETILSDETRENFLSTHKLPTTNCTFESCDAGLQIISPDISNDGAVHITLVDGYYAALKLRRTNRTAFDYLTRYKQILNYTNDVGYEFSYEAALIETTKNNNYSIERINFAPYHLDKMQPEDFQEYVEISKEFADIVGNVENQRELKLTLQTLLILDNWRICWKAYVDQEKTKESNAQAPILDCIYVARKTYLSSFT